jgi:hypothetical protein
MRCQLTTGCEDSTADTTGCEDSTRGNDLKTTPKGF